MSFLIGLLTVVLVLDCLLLILLVLIQLPKKDAGAGLAFGGAATDALFGAGTGNVLTKVTKYATVSFFVLAMIVSIMQSKFYHRNTTEFERALKQQSSQLPAQPSSSIPPVAPSTTPSVSNVLTMPVSAPAEATPSTSAPAAQK